MFNSPLFDFVIAIKFSPLSAMILLIIVLLMVLRVIMLRENGGIGDGSLASKLANIIVIISLVSALLAFVAITFAIV